jgi:hypothetical protein
VAATVTPDGWRVEVIRTRNGEVLRVRRPVVIGGHGGLPYAPAHTANLAGVHRNSCSTVLFTCTTCPTRLPHEARRGTQRVKRRNKVRVLSDAFARRVHHSPATHAPGLEYLRLALRRYPDWFFG